MRYLLYHLRWQLSTPILWYVVDTLGSGVYQTVIANVIGACIFYFVDKYIFCRKELKRYNRIARKGNEARVSVGRPIAGAESTSVARKG